MKVSDITHRRGVPHLRVHGKRSKIRYVELHPATAEEIHAYLDTAGDGDDKRGGLFRPLQNNYTNVYRKGLHPQSIARILHKYALEVGIDPESFSVHVTRVTAATKAHENGADLRELKD